MRHGKQRHSFGTLSELNVTPLLDLAFVLLIIFMITAPFLAESADLTIPSSKASRDAIDPAKVFTISIDKFRMVELDGAPLELADLSSGIRQLKEQNPGMGVVIKAHKELRVQDLVGVMDTVRDAGVAKVGVVTKPAGDES
jgi:biopolymer transport protein ExbD